MFANTYYDKALANFKHAKIVYAFARDDDEQLNLIAYHLEQALELAIKYILFMNGAPIQKTHDIDQLINYATKNNIELYLNEYLLEHAEAISNYESKTRYIMGYSVAIKQVKNLIQALDDYFLVLVQKFS